MILLAGGTGMLGREVVLLLSARGLKVRVLTRDPRRARDLENDLVEVVDADVREPTTLGPALAGIQTVVSAMSGYGPRSGANPRSVDGKGNRSLIRAAEAAGVEHFVLLSVHGAVPDHPMELHRMKFLAEQDLRESRMAWTIIRPTAFMETWAMIIGEPLLKKGKALIFGRGENPINFVSAEDVARFVELAVVDSAMRGVAVDVGGPENLTVNQFAEIFGAVTGNAVPKTHIPRTAMRLIALVMKPLNPTLARMSQAGVVTDTVDMTFDPGELGENFPEIPLSRLADIVRRKYGAADSANMAQRGVPYGR